jgi:hypothetical protein
LHLQLMCGANFPNKLNYLELLHVLLNVCTATYPIAIHGLPRSTPTK